MQLVSEVLEEVLDLKIMTKNIDTLRGSQIYSEDIENRYDEEWHIIKQTVDSVAKTQNEKILQENHLNTRFKTDGYGNITESIGYMCFGINEIQSDHQIFELEYDDNKRLIRKCGDTFRLLKDGTKVPFTMQMEISYDENGNYKMVTINLISKNHNAKISEIKDAFTTQSYLFEYDDADCLQSIDLMTFYNEHPISSSSLTRYVLDYNENMISGIHQIGTDAKDDEIFSYFKDGTITVTKNEYSDNMVVGKTMVTFMQPYYNEYK